MKRYKFELTITENEYASMRGDFSHKFYRDRDCLHITTLNRKKLVRDLETLIDFGEITAAEVLGI